MGIEGLGHVSSAPVSRSTTRATGSALAVNMIIGIVDLDRSRRQTVLAREQEVEHHETDTCRQKDLVHGARVIGGGNAKAVLLQKRETMARIFAIILADQYVG